MGVMGAGRLRSVVLAWACGVTCVLGVLGAVIPGSAYAANPFGESGSGAGQLSNPLGIGLDQQSGDVYVPEFYNERVSKFDGSGSFLFAWGWEVNAEHPARELQTCTSATECDQGVAGQGSGEFASSCGAQAVAVDNDPLSSSYEDVYVADFCNYRVQKFDPSGKFLLTFGGHVNEAQDANPGATEAQRDVCVAGEACTAGTPGGAGGEFSWTYEAPNIAVGPSGDVYVGDQARVEVFEPSGVWKEDVSLKGLTAEGKVTALAVDSKGDVFVKVEGVPGVRELEPGGTEASVKFDSSSETVEALTVDESSGNLFVADSAGSLHIVQYGPTGAELESFGSKTATRTRGIAYSQALHELYVADSSKWNVWRLAVPATGPVVEPGSEVATPGLRGAASLQATIDPEGNDTSYHFEYVTDEQFNTSGFAGASSTPTTPVGASSEDFEEHPVEAVLAAKTLVLGVTYHWRVVASDTTGQTTLGSSESFGETPAARIEGPWSTDVASSSATLAAQIDPLGSNTSYSLEVHGPSYEHLFTGNVGEGMGDVPISFHIQNLQAGAVYHYNLTTTSQTGTTESAPHSFTTQLTGTELTLPDGRAWELVTPANKKGALVEPFTSVANVPMIQAAADGSGIAYYTTGPNVGEHPQGNITTSPALSRRTGDGWRTGDMTLPESIGELPEDHPASFSFRPEYAYFSTDLSSAIAEPYYFGTPPLSSEATEYTPYARDNLTGAFAPLLTPADVVPGVHFGAEGEEERKLGYRTQEELMLKVLAATPDLRHVVLGSAMALTPGALSESVTEIRHGWNLYEWAEGAGLRLVNILPDRKQAVPTPGAGGMVLAGQNRAESFPNGSVGRAISDDGRWVAWTWGTPYQALWSKSWSHIDYHGLYVRDTVAGRTYRVGGKRALYQGMSSDGLRIFYIEEGSLYVFEPLVGTEGATTDLTGTLLGAGEAGPGVEEDVVGTSEDGAYVYFVATGVLASGASSGENNLYVAHHSSGGWSVEHIVTLAHEDVPDWWSNAFANWPSRMRVTSRVSPNGRYLAFMSERSLTGYDNIDAISGKPDEEVYLYDVAGQGGKGNVACVSCDPTGARPVGVYDHWGPHGTGELPLVDRVEGGAWNGHQGRSPKSLEEVGQPHWLAGSLPSSYGYDLATHQPRFLSDSGRLFFNGADALVPQDSNGLEDVYEYEPPGVGNCTSGSVTFQSGSGGCIDLVSSGTSSEESDFFDASENGNDAFFITTSKLVGADYDSGFDIYDAHVCSSSVPCVTEAAVPPPCTSGDSCKPAPSPQPEIFGSAPSATFAGQGNVVEGSKATVRARSLTRTQKLARALRACQKKKDRKKRASCKRQARERYAVKRSRKAGKSKGQG